jgi:hypothetical protein
MVARLIFWRLMNRGRRPLALQAGFRGSVILYPSMVDGLRRAVRGRLSMSAAGALASSLLISVDADVNSADFGVELYSVTC